MTEPSPNLETATTPQARVVPPHSGWGTVQNTAIAYASTLLTHYCFDVEAETVADLIDQWLQNYQANWICLAVIEALFQGRYKAYSVEQILVTWGRRGKPIYHFTHEFERLICRRFPQNSKTTSHPLLDYSRIILRPAEPKLVSRSLPPDPPSVATKTNPALLRKQPQLRFSHDRGSRLQRLEQLDRSWLSGSQPIHRFIPPFTAPELYTRLKAVITHSQQYDR
jgi:hypothetical protein